MAMTDAEQMASMQQRLDALEAEMRVMVELVRRVIIALPRDREFHQPLNSTTHAINEYSREHPEQQVLIRAALIRFGLMRTARY
ncbi:MAG TPA: hypothetical protein VK660_07615 [Xanthomonadaceae bacterium]|jgi:hypothetical protein|nr:hypothetical protein [Xanthomonadaceae bacterium]